MQDCVSTNSGRTVSTAAVVIQYIIEERPLGGAYLENLKNIGLKNLMMIVAKLNGAMWIVITPLLKAQEYGSG